jgi:hypothetical protein
MIPLHGRYALERIPEYPLDGYSIDKIEELPGWNIVAKLPSLTTRSSRWFCFASL